MHSKLWIIIKSHFKNDLGFTLAMSVLLELKKKKKNQQPADKNLTSYRRSIFLLEELLLALFSLGERNEFYFSV